MKCRICLGENADKDIYSLPKAIGVEKSSKDVLLFCLGIELTNKPKITTKLCSECHTLVQQYYRFKLLAHKSNSYLLSLKLYNNGGIKEPKEEFKEEAECNEYDYLEPEIFDENSNDTIKFEPEIPDNFVEDMTVELNPSVLDNYWDEDKTSEFMTTTIEQCEPNEPAPKSRLNKDSKKEIKKKVQKSQKLESCKLCCKTFRSQRMLQFHQRKVHPLDIERFQCDHCGQTYFTKADLQQHIDKLHLEWRCSHCRILFKSRGNYEKHSKVHDINYKPETKVFKANCKVCPVCGKLVSHLSLHLSRHRGDLYPCDACDKKFRSAGGRKRHYRVKHEGVMYRCNICDVDVTDLQSHRLRHHTADGLKHKCPLCPFRSTTASAVGKHMSTHLEPHIPCPKCQKLFKNESRLKLHCRQVHEGEVRHKCSECSKGFFYKSDLTIHMSCHTSEKPFRCDQCYEPFKLRRILIKHMKTKHKIN